MPFEGEITHEHEMQIGTQIRAYGFGGLLSGAGKTTATFPFTTALLRNRGTFPRHYCNTQFIARGSSDWFAITPLHLLFVDHPGSYSLQNQLGILVSGRSSSLRWSSLGVASLSALFHSPFYPIHFPTPCAIRGPQGAEG